MTRPAGIDRTTSCTAASKSSGPSGPAALVTRASMAQSAAMTGPVGRALVELTGVRPGDDVLDVGCGRGAVLFAAAEATGQTGSVLGFDLAAGMVERTRADAESRGLSTVRVEQRNAQEPDLPPAAFDVVVSSLVVFVCAAGHHHVRGPRRP